MINFVAIDFETANASRDSACALGAVVVHDGKIVERKYSLIRLHGEFSPFCTYIHGITKDAVKDSPTFEDLYPVIFKMLDGQVLAAHNASFDIAVLRASCEARKLKMPSIQSFCSVEMAKKAWTHLTKYKLNLLCDEFGISLKHHNAIEDATACAMIILKCAEQFSAHSMMQLQTILQKKAFADALVRKEAKKEEEAQKLLLEKENTEVSQSI